MRELATVVGLGAWVSLVSCSDHTGDANADGWSASATTAGGAATLGSGGAVGASGAEASAGASGAAPAPCSEVESQLDAQCSDDSSIFASELVDHSFGPGQDTGQDGFPDLVFGPPQGKGADQGATEGVVSLGNGGWVVLGFGGNVIVDGPGVDFIVFENAFRYGADGENVFAELATVSVSTDGEHWVDFPCTASEAPYGSCAGWHPVVANGDEQELTELDPNTAGGDGYDLAQVCMEHARYVRITDREDLDAALDGVFDLDAVGIVNGVCELP